MTSKIVMMISIITIIAISGEAAPSRLDKEFLWDETKSLKFIKTKHDATPAESIIEESGGRLKRSWGGDGGLGSVMFLTSSETDKDVNTDVDAEPIQGNHNRLERSCGGDDGQCSVMFLASSETDKDVNTDVDAEPIQGNDERLKRSFGGDGVRGSVMFLTSARTFHDFNTDVDSQILQKSGERERRRRPPYNIIVEYKGSGLEKFSTSLDSDSYKDEKRY